MEDKKYLCGECGQRAKQLNLNHGTRKWICNDCYFKEETDEERKALAGDYTAPLKQY